MKQPVPNDQIGGTGMEPSNWLTLLAIVIAVPSTVLSISELMERRKKRKEKEK
jgi:hypothetical protein